MHEDQFITLIHLITRSVTELSNLSSSLAQLVVIEKQRAICEEKYMITADELGKLADAVTALITAKIDDDASIASLKAQIATMTANDADLADPALQAKMDALTVAAAAATIDPNAIPPVAPVAPVAPVGAP